MRLIKKIYQSEQFPWNVVFVLFIGLLISGIFFQASECESAFTEIFGGFISTTITLKLLSILLAFTIPLLYRNTIRESNILGIRERVSPYPIGLFAVTALFSCNGFLLLAAAFIILLLFRRLVQIKEDQSQSPAGFDSGVLVALAAFISPYFLGLMVFVIVSLSFNRALSWRAIIWSLIGLCSPFYVYITVSYLHSGDWELIPFHGLWIPEMSETVSPATMVLKILYLALSLAMFILMLLRSIKSARSGIVRRRKVIRLGITLLIVTGIISFLLFQFEGVQPYFSILSIPLAVIFIEMNKDDKSSLDEAMYVLWLIFSCIISWI